MRFDLTEMSCEILIELFVGLYGLDVILSCACGALALHEDDLFIYY